MIASVRAVDQSAVHTLRPDGVGLASAVIARAFHDDPLTVHLYPDEQQRMRLNPVMFEALVRYDCLFGQVDHLPDSRRSDMGAAR